MEIKLYWKYLKYDIDQETWKGAKVRITGDENSEVLNEAQTGVDAFDLNYCYRKIEQGMMNLQDILHKFFTSYASEKGTTTGDNTLDNSSAYWTLTFDFDGRRNVNNKLLASELHKYIVFNVLQEWSKIALPAMEADYQARLNAEADRIKAICFRKEMPELDDTDTATVAEDVNGDGKVDTNDVLKVQEYINSH